MSQHRASIGGIIGGTTRRANPASANSIVAVLVVALVCAAMVGSFQQHMFVHVMAGLLWAGANLFMGAILGPVAGSLSNKQSAAVFERLTLKTSFFLPSMASVTIAGDITPARRLGVLPHTGPRLALFVAANLTPTCLLLGRHLNARHDPRWQAIFTVIVVGSLTWVVTTTGDFRMTTPATVVALIVITTLSMRDFGFPMSSKIRMCLEMTSEDPDPGIISTIEKQDAMLGGVQGVFQLVPIVDMVYLRYGDF